MRTSASEKPFLSAKCPHCPPSDYGRLFTDGPLQRIVVYKLIYYRIEKQNIVRDFN